jgi:hypothetical protein
MSFYTGRTVDGSDMMEAQGMYISDCGTYWSNQPITDEQKKDAKEYEYHQRMHNNIHNHLNGCRSFKKEYNLIKKKQSTLPKSLRDYLIKWFEG